MLLDKIYASHIKYGIGPHIFRESQLNFTRYLKVCYKNVLKSILLEFSYNTLTNYLLSSHLNHLPIQLIIQVT